MNGASQTASTIPFRKKSGFVCWACAVFSVALMMLPLAGFAFMAAIVCGGKPFSAEIACIFAVFSFCVVFLFFLGLELARFMLRMRRAGPDAVAFDSGGFTLNCSIYYGGYVPWDDVADLVFHPESRDGYTSIVVRNPGEYVSRGKTPFLRLMMRFNRMAAGSPVVVNGTYTSVSSEELFLFLRGKKIEFEKGLKQ